MPGAIRQGGSPAPCCIQHPIKIKSPKKPANSPCQDPKSIISLNPHDRAAEYHNLAAHAHSAAAASHSQGSLTAHELSRQAHEHSTRAFEESRKAAEAHGELEASAASAKK